MSNAQSSLAPYAHLNHEPDPDRAWALAKQAWHDHGILLVNLSEAEARAGWVAARQARNLGEQIFGKRSAGK